MGFTATGISTTTVTTDQQAPLGFKLTVPDGDNGTQEWTYILADEALVIGDVVVVNDTGLTTGGAAFHGIQSNGTVASELVLGVAQHVIALNSYGFVQSGGQATYVKGGGSVAAYNAVISSTSGESVILGTDQGEAVFGFALADDAPNAGKTGHSVAVYAAMLNCGI